MVRCGKGSGGKLNIDRRMASHCALPGTDTSAWTGTNLVQIRMGAPADYSREGQPDDDMVGSWHHPMEDMLQAGCPGAWYRTDWISSVLRYYRRAVDGRGRIPNPSLDQCDDWLVHEAIQDLEAWEDAAHGDLMEAYRRQAERQRSDG